MKTAMAAIVVVLSLVVLPVRAQLGTEVTVTVPEGGRFIFSNFAFRFIDYSRVLDYVEIILGGQVRNLTSKDWETMSFEVKFYNALGNLIVASGSRLYLYDLKKGATQTFDQKGHWKVLREDWGSGPSRYEIVWSEGLEAEAYDPKRNWTPIQTTILVQRGSPLRIVKAEGFWRPVEYVSSQAYWVVEMTIKNTSAKTIVAYEIPSVLFNSFGERVAGLTGVNAPGLRLAPGATLDGSYEQVNMGASGGSMVKVWISRVKFSDGSVWVNR